MARIVGWRAQAVKRGGSRSSCVDVGENRARRAYATIATSTGGQILFDRQPQSESEERSDKQPELFDLHVMMFAGDSSTTSASLQRVFALDAAAAERLLREVPVVVKRAASPEVAAELIDELQKIGAQVVLLPSARSAGAAIEPEPVPRAAEKPRWGGLDLESTSERERRVALDLAPALDMSPNARARALVLERSATPLPAPRASLISASEPPESETSAAPNAELELEREAVEPRGRRPVRAPASTQPAGESVSDLPPALAGDDLGLGTVPPLPSISLAAPPPKPKAPPPPPPPPPATIARAAPKPPRVPGPPPPPVALPALPSPPPAPLPSVPSVPAPSSRERRITAAALAGSAVPAARSALELAAVERTPPRVAGAAAPKPATDHYWSARRTGETAPETTSRAVDSEVANQSPATTPAAEARKPVQASGSLAVPKQRGLALLEMIAGALVIYAGMRLDNSVFYGNATPVSLVLHGFAFYGLGIGLLGLWP